MDPEAKAIVAAIREILEQCGENEWSKTFKYFGDRMDAEGEDVKREIRSIYGGMGSFGDVVVYREGRADRFLNDKLDALRHRLYELCRS